MEDSKVNSEFSGQSLGALVRAHFVENWKKWCLTVGSIVVFIAAINFAQVSSGQLLAAYSSFTVQALLLAAGAVLLQVLSQGTRLWLLCPSYSSFGSVIRAFLYGQSINTILPARIGDALKITYIKKEMPSFPLAEITGILIADKVLDTLVFLAFVALLVATAGQGLLKLLPAMNAGYYAGIAAVVVIAITGLLVWLNKKHKNIFGGLISGLSSIKSKRAIPAGIISVLPWAAEFFALLTLCRALGFEIGIAGAFFSLLLLNLAISVPISFANVGPFEAALGFALTQFGVPVADAIAIASTHHLLQVGVPTTVALILWTISKVFYREGLSISIDKNAKQKAVDHYAGSAQSADGYEEQVNRSFLKTFRDLERSAVQKLISESGAKGRLLDVGCGAGVHSLFAKNLGMHVTSTDIVPEMLSVLKTKVDETLVLDIETDEIPNQYDVVICIGVLDFVTDPNKVFRKLAGAVQPGGTLITMTPRLGLGGFYYRIEKFVTNMRSNLYTLGWFKKQAEKHSLKLNAAFYPLPTNMALRFEKI